MINKKKISFYKKNGFLKLKLLSREDIFFLKKKIASDLRKKYFLKFKKKLNFDKLENYHKLKLSENEHRYLVKPGHRFFVFNRKISKKILNNQIMDLIRSQWGYSTLSLYWIGNLKKNKNQKLKNATGYRIARPKQKIKTKDVAGVHIDVNAGGLINKDVLSSITIWIPLVGFSKRSTLRISPKSHLKRHKIKFLKSQKKVTPLIQKNYWKKFNFTRLNFKQGEALIFHPNLLHGGSENLNADTRISLDTRVLNPKRFKY